MSPDAECENPEGNERPFLQQPEVLSKLCRLHANALNDVVESLAEDIESNGTPSSQRINSARTELRELEALIEDQGADLCDNTDPWGYLDEFGLSKL